LTSWRARLRPEARRTVFFLAFAEVAMLCTGFSGAKTIEYSTRPVGWKVGLPIIGPT
jgi:hypothetical protein